MAAIVTRHAYLSLKDDGQVVNGLRVATGEVAMTDVPVKG